MLPKSLTSRRKAAHLRPETPLSRRYLKVIEKWIPVGLAYFEDWPDRPNSGHFLGGCHWYGIETIAGALAFAAAGSSPEYDAKAAGCSRKEVREIALKAIRYLCFTHDTGPKGCVRPLKGLGHPANFGTKWGERGLGFFRESQCGLTVADMATVALLLGNTVDDETWRMLTKMHEDYARRFGTMAPKSGVYTNTQMEENGWTSCGLASAECLLSGSPKAATWAQGARRWMFSTATAQQDTQNHGIIADGVTARQLTGQTFTTLPDYMAENHGMVHPSYTASAVGFLGHLAITYAAFGQTVPPHACYNRSEIYDQLKLTTDSTGSLHPVQGMDWPYLFTDPGTTTHGAAAAVLGDPDAANLERRALSTLEARQDSNGGRMYDAEVAAKAHGPQDPIAVRECVIAGPAHTYLLHRLCGDGPRPSPNAAMERKLRGVRTYPHSGFVFHRHRKGQTSFSWRNCVMALPLNRDGIQTVAPAPDSFLGSISVKNRPDRHQLVSVNVDEHADGFAAALVMDRAQGAVRQEVLFAGLPDGITLSCERLTARETITVERVEQGFLRIINERFTALKGNCNGYRKVYTPEGSERFEGFISDDPDSDVVRTCNQPGWVNVDDRIAIVFQGPGKTVYHNRHFFKPWRAVADDLTLSRIDRKFRVQAGKPVATFTALLAPDVSHKRMADLKLIAPKAPRDVTALLAQGHLAAASFSDRAKTVALEVQRRDLEGIPVFSGTATISASAVKYGVRLRPGEAALKKALLTIRTDRNLCITAAETGDIVARNLGRKVATVQIDGSQKTTRIRPGESADLN